MIVEEELDIRDLRNQLIQELRVAISYDDDTLVRQKMSALGALSDYQKKISEKETIDE